MLRQALAKRMAIGDLFGRVIDTPMKLPEFSDGSNLRQSSADTTCCCKGSRTVRRACSKLSAERKASSLPLRFQSNPSSLSS